MRGPIPGTIHNLCVEFNNKILPPKTRQKQPLAKGNLSDWYTGTPKTRETQIATSADGTRRVLPGSKNYPRSILAYQFLCDHKREAKPQSNAQSQAQKTQATCPKTAKGTIVAAKAGRPTTGQPNWGAVFIGERTKKGFFSPFFVVISFLGFSCQPETVLCFRNGR